MAIIFRDALDAFPLPPTTRPSLGSGRAFSVIPHKQHFKKPLEIKKLRPTILYVQSKQTKIDKLLEEIAIKDFHNNKENYYNKEKMRQAYNHLLEERDATDWVSPWAKYNTLIKIKDGEVHSCLLLETTDREIFYRFLRS